MRWDVFCRVIDNHGDIGVCWRLAADLASRGERVRLWTDDASALAWMAPSGAPGIEVRDWPHHRTGEIDLEPADVVIEAFGCTLPDAYLARMAAAAPTPCWINLEYLSAEAYVERSHRLASPQATGPGAGLRKWFFYPGFTARTGGLLREQDLATRLRAFNRHSWLAAMDAALRPGERVLSLFCYEVPALAAWLASWAAQPTLLLATAGHALRQVEAVLGPDLQLGQLRAVPIPRLSQRDYDHLLWSADLNFVRGEDSFVRAQWAGTPFVWHIYPQQDGAHVGKLDAFLDRFGADRAVRDCFRAWNDIGHGHHPSPPPPLAPWRQACANWRTSLCMQRDLTTQLLDFVAETR